MSTLSRRQKGTSSLRTFHYSFLLKRVFNCCVFFSLALWLLISSTGLTEVPFDAVFFYNYNQLLCFKRKNQLLRLIRDLSGVEKQKPGLQ